MGEATSQTAKTLLPVDVHRLKMSFLKLTIEPLELKLQGSLSNDDGDVNENGKKAIGLDMTRKTTTLHVHHAFLYIS